MLMSFCDPTKIFVDLIKKYYKTLCFRLNEKKEKKKIIFSILL